MKHIKAVAGYILILSLCLVCAYPAHAETRRIALIHSFEPGYPPAAKALELLQREFSLLGLDCDVREYYLDCDRYMEEAENLRMAGFVDDLSAWGAELIAVLDDQAAYALMACRHPLAHEIPVVFSGVNYPNISLLLQYPNITGYADTPDYLRTIRMIESIMGKSRICLMNGQVFLDRKIWHALNEQCRGQGFAIVTSTEGAYFAGSSYHRVRERETISPILKRQNIDVLLDTTKIVRMTSDSIAIRHLMWLGRGDNTLLLYTKRDYTTKRVGMLFDNPTFQTINEGFGFADYLLGGYFTPLESQIRYMATGIKERLEGRMPRQQVTECAKQYVLNWHVLQKYGIPLESIPVEYTVMYIPFSERYRYPILIGSILGAVFVLTVIVLLSFSLLRERRRKREALRNLLYEHETLCLAIEGNSTYAWRLEGDSVSCDSQFCELIHHRPGRLLLDEITPYIHPDDLPAFRKNIAARHERTHHKGQYRCNFTGEFQWWEFSYNTIHTPGHAPIIAGLLQNIQELKDHEQELIESRELAEQAELKQSFLNNMSHEIRTPLNAIVGFSDMLANEPEFSNEERQEFVDIINTNTKLLLKLVGDVLELSRIESGNLSFTFQRESVCRLLDDVYQTHSLLIRPPLQFLKDFPPEDVQVNVDPMRLTQVLTNFLNNANKFTKGGSIRLGYCCPSGMSEVHLYVEDTGIGIPHSEQKMIFERFYKRSEFSQGVGLGLSICVLIVEKMGGRIELQSEEGRGSRFTVVLPCIE
ncbi:sensor histidine kinase [Bacteroides uniformis]|jgi:signal transduction histidine kinase|uniref:histidine kinase n=1 Tax=Bacteroides uniformis TaxID=820 RepID=A0A412B9B5_BACUN|nr:MULTISPECIES: PAS domain-containing sensor histidine kinase [Bacteroides]MBF7064181.1 sensor histidine kinase [Bacteroides sp. HF-5613]MBV3827886.1 PAS domain-containing sensor histidine kinase [Bacteroides uniformis]MDY4225451.1 PAS domain-containing sensor histidine kinase [Bacteroides uniformis]QPH56739.1 sensor histidine kinase [Bacteroides sp. HF-162]RGQ49843.1 sensor histidine kinase [Bacteroides uniformis]